MSWAARRKLIYATGVALFLLIVIGGPIFYKIVTKPPTCTDGIQNQGETGVDIGGPCPVVDPNALSPSSVVWSRAFRVRNGSYNAVAMIQNPNAGIGALDVTYKFGLYDANNVLVAERTGSTYIMPGGITPIFEGAIDTGNRVVAHTYFDFTGATQWQHVTDGVGALQLSNVEIASPTDSPRVTADVKNNSVGELDHLSFVAVIYDPAGNAFAASYTTRDVLQSGETAGLIFTWPTSFNIQVGRVQVIPLLTPVVTAPGV